MIRKEVEITNRLGLHARPAAKIVKIASLSPTNFWISKDGQRVNGKSIMGVMMLAAEKGSTIIVEADGEGETELIQEVEKLIQEKFGED